VLQGARAAGWISRPCTTATSGRPTRSRRRPRRTSGAWPGPLDRTFVVPTAPGAGGMATDDYEGSSRFAPA
jgi:hypothetical protein